MKTQTREDALQYLEAHRAMFLRAAKEHGSDEPEETVQKAWLQIVNYDGSQPIRSLKRFVWQIVKREAYRRLDKKKREQELFDPLEFHYDTPSRGEGGFLKILGLKQAMDRLPERDQALLIRRYVGGETLEELSKVVGEPTYTLQYRLGKLRKKLQKVCSKP